ncbi:MAG: response regulator [Gammaproteobacteria bacterium]|nr:response regulator [Gammaproteobacteria bacterium]
MNQSTATAATVYVVDDNPAVRDAIRWLVEEVGLSAEVYATAQEFVDKFDAEAIGCLVLDIRMPGMGGLELQDYLLNNNISIPVIVVTGHGDVPMAVRSMKNGAFEFLQKPFNDQTLLDTIFLAIKRHQSIMVAARQRSQICQNLASLTRREEQVLKMLRTGQSSREIAECLHISVRTVEGHRAKIMDKMNSHSVAELLEFAHIAESA